MKRSDVIYTLYLVLSRVVYNNGLLCPQAPTYLFIQYYWFY